MTPEARGAGKTLRCRRRMPPAPWPAKADQSSRKIGTPPSMAAKREPKVDWVEMVWNQRNSVTGRLRDVEI